MQQDQKKKKTKKPLKPEEIVEKELEAAFKEMGLDMTNVESKAIYSQNQERYVRGQAEDGFPDFAGNDQNGIACYVEAKARGRVSTLRPAQLRFLLRKAQAGCFACCVDRPEVLFSLYLAWKAEGRKVLEQHLLAI